MLREEDIMKTKLHVDPVNPFVVCEETELC